MYHGSLVGTYVYDYMIRNAVRLFLYGFQWEHLSNMAMSLLFSAISVWCVISIWAKVRRNLIICLVLVIVIFVFRLGFGIQDARSNRAYVKQGDEDLIVFICQMVVHMFGVIATYILTNNNS